MQGKSKCKGFCVLLVFMLTVLSLAGCGKDSPEVQTEAIASGTGEDQASEASEPEAADAEEAGQKSDPVKSDGYEKFSQLKIGMTESEVNAILGEPASVDKAYYYYNITVNGNDLELTVWINMTTGLVTYLYGDFSKDEYRAEFVDSETDLSAVGGLESGEISTYDDCVSTFKTAGYLMSEDKDGVKTYLWVNSYDGYMRVTFYADGSVKTYSGVC